jgi:hypothetical protein
MVTHLHKSSIASTIEHQSILNFLHMRTVANPDTIRTVLHRAGQLKVTFFVIILPLKPLLGEVVLHLDQVSHKVT